MLIQLHKSKPKQQENRELKFPRIPILDWLHYWLFWICCHPLRNESKTLIFLVSYLGIQRLNNNFSNSTAYGLELYLNSLLSSDVSPSECLWIRPPNTFKYLKISFEDLSWRFDYLYKLSISMLAVHFLCFISNTCNQQPVEEFLTPLIAYCKLLT